jgi:hypothetical protein
MSYDSGSHIRPDISGFQATAMDMSFDEKYLFATSNITNTFRIYKYTESTNVWTQEYTTTGANGFGQDVSCTWDGDIAIVGSPLENKAYVYKSDPQAVNVWSSPITTTIERNAATLLYSSSHTPSINFGYSVSLSKNDGTFLAIGAPGDSTTSDHGEAWVLYLHSSTNNQLVYKVRTSNSGGYTLHTTTNSWLPTYPVVHRLPDYYWITDSGHRIGHSVNMSPYGEYLAIGAPGTPVPRIKWTTANNTNVINVNGSGSSPHSTGGYYNLDRSNDDYLQGIAMLGHIQVVYSTDSWTNNIFLTELITGNCETTLPPEGWQLTSAFAFDFPSCGEKVKISTDGRYVIGGSPRYGFAGSQGGAHWGKIEAWKREGIKMKLSPGRIIGQQPGDRLGKFFDIDYTGNRLACLLLRAPTQYATPYGNMQGGLMVYDFNGQAFFETTKEITDTVGENGSVDGLHGAICMSKGNTTILSALNGSSATGLIPSFYFKLTQTIDGNTLSGGYLAADTIVIGPNDGTTDNSYPKKLSFGGTYRDNSYENTQIENRIYHYDNTNYSEWEQGYSELLFRKKSQREAQDMIRFKSNEFRIDSYVNNTDGDYDHYPVLTMNQQGLIKLNPEMHFSDDTTVHTTSEMQCNTKALLDIEGDCFTRRRIDIGWPEGQNVFGSDRWAWSIIYDTRSPRVINWDGDEYSISSNVIAINNSPWVGKFRNDSIGTVSNPGSSGFDFEYKESECAFYMNGSYNGTAGYATNTNYIIQGANGHTISFWFKLTISQSSLTSNETLISIGTPNSTANNGVKIQLSATKIIMNFGTHTIESSIISLDTNKWYHLYTKFGDDNGNSNDMYLNGNELSLPTTTGTQPSSTGWTHHFHIGSTQGDSVKDCYIGMIAYGKHLPAGGYSGQSELPSWQDMYNWGPPTQRLIVGGDTIINNRLGIGTVLPNYTLDVDGDINFSGNITQNDGTFYALPWLTINQIPNVPMTSSTSGGYTISSSSTFSGTGWENWRAFNHTIGAEGWRSIEDYQSNPNTHSSLYIGSESTTYNGSLTVDGEWIQMYIPSGVITNRIDIAPWTNELDKSPKAGKILGSNDGSTWTLIHSFLDKTYTDGQYTNISFTNTVSYTYIRLVTEEIDAYGWSQSRAGTWYHWKGIYLGEIKIYASNPNICYNTGYVGIGNSNPGYELDVTGDINLTGNLRINGVAQTFGGSGSSFNGLIGDYIIHDGDTDTKFGFPSVDKFIVNTAGSERLTIFNNGNIGINQTNPQYKLDVDGDINMSTGSSFRINGVAQTFGGGSSYWVYNGATYSLSFLNGNVGIGTNSPGYTLDVAGDINMSTGSSFRINGVAQTFGGGGFTGNIADYITHTGDTDTKFGFPSVDKFIVNTAGSERLTIFNNGNIGINQTNPQYKLDVDGDINLTGDLRINGTIQTFGGGPSAWTTSGSDVYRASGKVGIGKTNPTHAVDVNGTVNATSYLGDGSNLTGVTASSITSEASRTISISTIKAQGGSWDVRS